MFLCFVDLRPNIMIVFFYQLDTQIVYYKTFIIFIYMFRALLCSSSGGQNCINTASGIVTLTVQYTGNLCTEQSPNE